MHIEELIGDGHEPLIPAVVSRFVAANEKNRRTTRIKGIQHPVRPAFVLDAQFLHIRVARCSHQIGIRSRQRWPALLQHPHDAIYAVLLAFGESGPLFAELIGELYFPFRQWNITSNE